MNFVALSANLHNKVLFLSLLFCMSFSFSMEKKRNFDPEEGNTVVKNKIMVLLKNRNTEKLKQYLSTLKFKDVEAIEDCWYKQKEIGNNLKFYIPMRKASIWGGGGILTSLLFWIIPVAVLDPHFPHFNGTLCYSNVQFGLDQLISSLEHIFSGGFLLGNHTSIENEIKDLKNANELFAKIDALRVKKNKKLLE